MSTPTNPTDGKMLTGAEAQSEMARAYHQVDRVPPAAGFADPAFVAEPGRTGPATHGTTPQQIVDRYPRPSTGSGFVSESTTPAPGPIGRAVRRLFGRG